MKMPNIDSNFIREWETNYYKCDEDYREEQRYQGLIESVKKDVAGGGTISEQTLKGILKWKLGPYYGEDGNVDWGKYEIVYVPRFRLIISESISDYHKLFILIWDEDKLKNKLPVVSGVLDNIHGNPHGFGVPVASTVLHFVFPDKFPIIDIRTAEMMYLACKIKSPNRYDYRIYDQFRSVMLEIVSKAGFTLHKIDRALFAYHRDVVQPEMNGMLKRWIAANKLGPELSLTLAAPPKLRRLVLDQIKKDP